MSNLDQVSTAIGELRGELSTHVKSIDASVLRIEKAITDHAADETKMWNSYEARVDSLEKTRTKAKTILWGFGAVVTTISGIVTAFINKII